jgi:outer membrane protein OmpA-like peptidoglycan-associated protein
MNYTAKHLLRISLSLMIVIPPVHARAYSKVGAIVGESAPEQNPEKFCSIFFSDNSTSVEQEVEKLQNVVLTVKENSGTKISLRAFASPFGTESYNKALCEKRLKVVMDYLLLNGVQEEDFAVVEYAGIDQSVRKSNLARRVDVYLEQAPVEAEPAVVEPAVEEKEEEVPVTAVAETASEEPAVEPAADGTVIIKDTLHVLFRVGQSDIDLDYADNGARIQAFVDHLRNDLKGAEGTTVTIYTGASPEGPAELNRRLGEQRGIALRKVLISHLQDKPVHISVVNEGARWKGLYDMVEASDEPWKADVLRILEQTPREEGGFQTESREKELRKLKKGKVWEALSANYLPALRGSGMAVVTEQPVPMVLTQHDTIVLRDTILYLPKPCPKPYVDHRNLLALKTNILLWGVLTPNIQLEIPLGTKGRWSIETEFFCSWWTWNRNTRAQQIMNLGVEGRYWLGNRERHHTLDGWHIGLAAAVGYYDLELKRSEGWQGEYLNVYFNGGYQHRFGRHKQWLVDGGLGLGYIPTQHRHYLGSSVYPVGYEESQDNHLMWQGTSWRHILGATHANISIGYLFGAGKTSKK